MQITKDHIGGLIFLLLSFTYGYYAGQIPLLPGDDFAPFNAQTLPNALTLIGLVLSVGLLVTASRDKADALKLSGYDFSLVAKLLGLVAIFGCALDWLGFFVATVLFLLGGYWLLGERRPKTLLVASLPFAAGIWLILTQLLDIYLAPGRVFSQLFGG
ncbi:tripartite tricarboxylate transporter TctB family protein [Neptuniibacter sp. CAU 1671]|uniref:tripartite tricarboxylate transporter TctB family protein n=1 Tax=Neptuniibacter sp. CAU 1671 TaxID=3032593 RepID=UPI0023DB2BAA|nr:tripartite tricarboxylate transporter TctB family protein [Neptuniibacter sp. CAU 1671]MDF2181966.1 tripartite tricarboxylate transporter TctB family protein [Neptuniibacter sp. CAU 1671]